MAATIVELTALEVDSEQDGRAAVERLAALGPVVLLVSHDEDPGRAAIAEHLGNLANVVIAEWTGVGHGRSGGGWQPKPGGGRTVDRTAVDQLSELQAAHGANWLIATDRTLASARACPGLLIACVGPVADRSDPVRPDHQAHSLLDAVRFIETADAFG
jgi:hypothetical protein